MSGKKNAKGKNINITALKKYGYAFSALTSRWGSHTVALL